MEISFLLIVLSEARNDAFVNVLTCEVTVCYNGMLHCVRCIVCVDYSQSAQSQYGQQSATAGGYGQQSQTQSYGGSASSGGSYDQCE